MLGGSSFALSAVSFALLLRPSRVLLYRWGSVPTNAQTSKLVAGSRDNAAIVSVRSVIPNPRLILSIYSG